MANGTHPVVPSSTAHPLALAPSTPAPSESPHGTESVVGEKQLHKMKVPTRIPPHKRKKWLEDQAAAAAAAAAAPIADMEALTLTGAGPSEL